jgi:hypothetical protein
LSVGQGFPIDYSITENGGPFRRPTLYHDDYRLVKGSTYGERPRALG